MKHAIWLFMMIAAALLEAPHALSRETAGRHDSLERFQNSLEVDGFVVRKGITDSMNWAEEYCAGKIPNGGYVNKASYVRVRVPRSSRETELTEVFQLRPDEAIVLIGLTPPPVNYFGYHAFLWTKTYPGPRRERMFATLGDTVNNATVHTTGPDPFGRPVALIFTPDRKIDTRMRAALQRAGYPAAIINTIVFPAPMLSLGHGDAADELRIVMRLGAWKDPDAGRAYMEGLTDKVAVFRVTPGMPASVDPLPVPRLRVRGTGQTEMDLRNTLDRLREGILDAYPGLYATDIPSRPNWYEGYDYIQRGVNPGADSRDAFFVSSGYLPEYGSVDRFTLADDEFLMVYGANHAATGKATYMSVNVYASETAKLSIGQVFDDALEGTAWPYLPGGGGETELLYAYKISRTCRGESNCLTLSADDYNSEDAACLTVDAETVLGVIFRMYLEPATSVGAAMPEVVYDRVIKFSPRK